MGHLILQCYLMLLENICNTFWNNRVSKQAALFSKLSWEREALHGYNPSATAGLSPKHQCLPSLTHIWLFNESFCHKILHGDKVSFNYLLTSRGSAQHWDCPVLGVLWKESWCGLCWGSCSRASRLKLKAKFINSIVLICDQTRDNVQIKINWTSNVWPWDSESTCKAASAYFWVTLKASKYLALQQNNFKAACTQHIHHYYYRKYEDRFTSTLQRNQISRGLWSFTNY